jgi:hypothetical protein
MQDADEQAAQALARRTTDLKRYREEVPDFIEALRTQTWAYNRQALQQAFDAAVNARIDAVLRQRGLIP